MAALNCSCTKFSNQTPHLVPHSDRDCQVLQAGQEYPELVLQGVREGQEGQEGHQVLGLP